MKLVPCKIVNKDGKPYIQVQIKDGETKVFSPEEIGAIILIKMKETAEAFLGKKIKDTVATVPTYFNDPHRPDRARELQKNNFGKKLSIAKFSLYCHRVVGERKRKGKLREEAVDFFIGDMQGMGVLLSTERYATNSPIGQQGSRGNRATWQQGKFHVQLICLFQGLME